MKPRQGRHSSLESHPQREKILEAVARHVPVKTIAAQFDVTVWVVYRWIAAHRLDKESRQAWRRLKGATLRADDPVESSGDALTDKLRDLETQKRRMLAVQDACIKTGDLQRAAYVSDVIARNVRHQSAIHEVLRVRLLGPAATFAASPEYQKLRADLLKISPPEAVEHTVAVLDHFEAGTPVPDELERLY
jgi:hypothetical protein